MRQAMRRVLFLLVMVVAVSGSTCGTTTPGTGTFPKTTAWTAQTINTDASFAPRFVATADFDGNGTLDVVVAYRGNNSIAPMIFLFLQTNPTTFTPVLIGTGDQFTGVTSLAVGNLGGDERPEVIAACNGQIVYLTATGDVSQTPNWSATVLDESSGDGIGQWTDVAIADIDGAEGPDIVACDRGPGGLSWFRAPPGATSGADWTRVDIDTTSRTQAASVATGDIDGDGRTDIYSTAPGEAGARVAWYRNPGGDASAAWSKFTIGNLPNATRLAIGDLDKDNDVDVVVTNPGGLQIGWYQRPADPTAAWSGFLLAQFSANTPIDVHVDDVDGNGQNDVVVATIGAPSFRWFTPVGAQTTQWVENNLADVTDIPQRFAIGDIDADGRADVVSSLDAASGANQTAWYANPE